MRQHRRAINDNGQGACAGREQDQALGPEMLVEQHARGNRLHAKGRRAPERAEPHEKRIRAGAGCLAATRIWVELCFLHISIRGSLLFGDHIDHRI
jgi:hypothetical protein